MTEKASHFGYVPIQPETYKIKVTISLLGVCSRHWWPSLFSENELRKNRVYMKRSTHQLFVFCSRPY